MKHLIAIPVCIELFERLVIEGQETKVRCIKGLPDDAKLVNSFYDGWQATAVLVYEHRSFPGLPQGVQIPRMSVEFKDVE